MPDRTKNGPAPGRPVAGFKRGSERLVGDRVVLDQPEPPEAILTERELDVLKGIARGLSNQEIAGELSIGVTTARTHVSSLFSKLGLANRTQAALYAVEHGLTD